MPNAKINNGFMDYFLLFEVYNHNNEKKRKSYYERNLNKLIESRLLISSETLEKEIKFSSTFNDEINRRKQIYKSCIENKKNFPFYLANDIKKTPFENNIEDLLYDSQADAIKQLVAMHNLETKHTGISMKEFKHRFLLWPIKVNLNGTYFYINVYLTTFKNGCSILHFSFELNEIDLEDLNKSTWNIEFEKVMFPEFMIIEDSHSMKYKKKARCKRLKDIGKVYYEYLLEVFWSRTSSITTEFNHLTLIDYDHMPERFENGATSDSFKTMMFKLLFPPVSEIILQSKDHINNTLENHYYDFSLYYRAYANYSRLVSAFSERMKKPFKTVNEKPISKQGLYYSSIGGVITSIEILMLKKHSYQKNSLGKINQNMSLKELIELKISENVDFVHEFSQFYFNFASVRDFTSFLENSCQDYLQTELLLNQRRRVEELIALKKEKNVARFTALSPILTILVTLIFSLPTLQQIYEILGLQNNLLLTYVLINGAFILFICYLYKEPITKKLIKFRDVFLKTLIQTFKFIKKRYNFLRLKITSLFKK